VSYQIFPAPAFYRQKEGLGVWKHRGKVAAVGIGHAPTLRRWDWQPETSVGAWSILAVRKAIEDAGVDPAEIDGLAMVNDTSTGAHWPEGRQAPAEFYQMFKQTDDVWDGLTKLSPDWILQNVPELTGIRFVSLAFSCVSNALPAAIQAIGDGLCHTCLVLKGWHNLEGRYMHGGPASQPTVSGPNKWVSGMAGPSSYMTAMQFQHYLDKYNKTHEMMAPFVVNSRNNGLLFPEGYFAQHRPQPLTEDDYNDARWIAKPASLLDNDMPIHSAAAYIITTADRARDLRQKPAYVLGHAGAGEVSGETFGAVKARGMIETLEEVETACAATGRKVLESAGINVNDLSFENMYDGFTLFHVFHIEGIGYAGIKRGEALDFFKTDISIKGPNPVSPSGGNIGGGRTRFWMHTDAIQQIQGRAGARQIAKPAEIGISGGTMPTRSNFIVWSATPN
jgi:acetyl-CoA acetyltransferase